MYHVTSLMGYSEIRCRICGVSFNFSRIRTRGEPQKDAIKSTGDGVYPGFIEETGFSSDCVDKAECSLIRRIVERRPAFDSEAAEEQSVARTASTATLSKEDGSDDEDSDYVGEAHDNVQDEFEYESGDENSTDVGKSDGSNTDSQEGDCDSWRQFLVGEEEVAGARSWLKDEIYLPIGDSIILTASQTEANKNSGKST